MDFCLEKYPNMNVFVHFTIFIIQNLIYQERKRLSIFMGFQNANEDSFHGFWKFCYFLLCKSFGSFLEGACTNPACNSVSKIHLSPCDCMQLELNMKVHMTIERIMHATKTPGFR